MTDEVSPSAELRAEMTWTDKVVALTRDCVKPAFRYAFGGAIAMNYHREPRATLDIDINAFLDPHDEDQALRVLRDPACFLVVHQTACSSRVGRGP